MEDSSESSKDFADFSLTYLIIEKENFFQSSFSFSCFLILLLSLLLVNLYSEVIDQNLCIWFNRKRLFSLINELPTVYEVVTGRKPLKDKPGVDSGSKSKSNKVK